jgi:hypothetical protein
MAIMLLEADGTRIACGEVPVVVTEAARKPHKKTQPPAHFIRV